MFFKPKKRGYHSTFAKAAPRRKKTEINWKALVWGGFFILLLAALLWLALFSPWVRINQIKTADGKTVLAADIQNAAGEQLGGMFLKFIPRSDYFVFNAGDFEKKLRERFPQIDSLSIKKVFPKKLEVSFGEKETAAIWCLEAYLAEATSTPERLSVPEAADCYFLDKNGIAFRQAPEMSGTLLSAFYGQKDDFSLGQQVIDPKKMAFGDEVKKELREAGVAVSAFKDGAGPEIMGITDESWTIYFDSSRSAKSQAKVVEALLNGAAKAKRSTLSYIDLRMANRAYFK